MTVSFLLGAGSSKPLGIPTTEGMAKEFLSVSSNPLVDLVFKKKTGGDIETLVKAVHQIKELRNNYGIGLLRAQGHKLDKVDEISKSFAETEKQLTEFIREKCLNPDISKTIKLYTSLLKLSEITTVKIFTTNYDVIIEEVCHNNKMEYSDGFVTEEHGYYKSFTPSELAFSKKPIHLYKIHGSVNWWTDESRQKIIKLSPDMNTGREKYDNTMIYPAEKEDIFNYPFNLLQWFFGNDLNNTKKLYAIGHKFGDPNITATIKDTLENPKFELIIINPNASKIRKKIFNDHERITAIDKSIEEWMKKGIPAIRTEVIQQNKKIEKEKKAIDNEREKMTESQKKINELQEKVSKLEHGTGSTLSNIFTTTRFTEPTSVRFFTSDPETTSTTIATDDLVTGSPDVYWGDTTSSNPGRCPNCQKINSMGADKVCTQCGYAFKD